MPTDRFTMERSEPSEVLSTQITKYSELTLTGAADADTLFGQYWVSIVRRRWTVASCVAITVLLASIVSFRMTPLYESVGDIEVTRETPESMGIRDITTTTSNPDALALQLETEVRTLLSDATLIAVIHKMHLETVPFTSRRLGARPIAAADGTVGNAQETDLAAELRAGLSIAAIPNTRLIEIHYTSPNPQLSADIVNNLAAIFIEQNIRSKYDSTVQASNFLSTQLADLQMKVEISQKKLAEYQKNNNIIGFDDKHNIVTEKLADLNRELTAAMAERIQRQSRFEFFSKNPASIMGATPNAAQERLRQESSELTAQLAELSVQYGPAHPKIQELQSKRKDVEESIAAEYKNMSASLHNEYLAAAQREQMLQADFEKQKNEATELDRNAAEYNMLRREAEDNRQLYDGLLHKLKEAGIAAGLKSSNIRIMSPARVHLKPTQPNIPRNIIVAFLLSLFAGIGFAIVQDVRQKVIRTQDDVEFTTGIGSLGLIPLIRAPRLLERRTEVATEAKPQADLILLRSPGSSVSEAYKALRTSILLCDFESKKKIVLLASALPKEGKTTTSINLGISFSQKGARTLIIDADLRRPSVHKHFAMSSLSGLSSILTGKDSVADVIVPYAQIPNLFVLPSGPSPSNPAELLGSTAMSTLLAYCREHFDQVFIDTPPVLSVTDAVVLSISADSVILVARAAVTPKLALKRAAKMLVQNSRARIIGVVINGADLSTSDYNYYYGYGSKYGSQYYRSQA